jgi:hypothetical protein
MAKQSYPIPKVNNLAPMSVTFFLIWAVTAVVISLANTFMPEQIVLGTMTVNRMMALLLSSGIIAWATTITMPIFTEIEVRKQMILAPQHWIIGYLIINVAALWVTTRFADVIGLGVSSWVYVVGLAAVLDFVQGMVMMAYGASPNK